MNSFKTPKGTTLPLMDIKGKQYLQVAHRLVWFREEHADWTLETSVEIKEDNAIGRCIVLDASGRHIASGTKYEDRKGFQDFIEKAETGAIGRALAFCGYGTQFTIDLQEGERLADAPLEKKTIVDQAMDRAFQNPISDPSTNTGTSQASPIVGKDPNPNPAVHCELCGSLLALSKSKERYFCRNFKNTTLGQHTVIDVGEIETYKARENTMKPSREPGDEDVPFFDK